MRPKEMTFNDALLDLSTAPDHEQGGGQVICFPGLILAYVLTIHNLRSS